MKFYLKFSQAVAKLADIMVSYSDTWINDLIDYTTFTLFLSGGRRDVRPLLGRSNGRRTIPNRNITEGHDK